MLLSPYQAVCPANFLMLLKGIGIFQQMYSLTVYKATGPSTTDATHFVFTVSLTKITLMRKFAFSVMFSSAVIFLQAQAFEDKIEYNKEKQACIVMEYNFVPQAVENAVIAKMNKLGYKGKEEKGMFNKDKGFRLYKDVMINDISPERYDYVVNIDRKSKKESDAAVLYLIVMKDGSNALSRMNTEELGKAKAFLYNLLPEIEEANLELQITAQEDVVVKAEKKLKGLQTDKDDMEKKIKKLQDDIRQNEKDQEKQTSEIETQRKSLDALRAKRKASA
jgi:hypothetical protein